MKCIIPVWNVRQWLSVSLLNVLKLAVYVIPIFYIDFSTWAGITLKVEYEMAIKKISLFSELPKGICFT